MATHKGKKQDTDLAQYYTATQAATVLSANSGRRINPAYLRQMARTGLIEPYKVTEHLYLYPKSVIDTYIVRPRGENLTSEGRKSRKPE
jgi:hypothetical protein